MAKKAAKKTTTAKKATTKKASRKKKAEAGSRGLAPTELTPGDPPDAVTELADDVAKDGGAVLATYQDPLGGAWQMLVALPVEKVEPAPFQRDLSDTHVKKLASILDRLDRYLDPVILVRAGDSGYWTPNGHHRLAAMKKLGTRSILGLLVPEFEIAYQILALNTEKAPGLKERSLEVIRLARALAELGDSSETDYAVQFEEAGLLTLGCCYEEQPRFSGSSYQPLLKRCDDFLEESLGETLAVRQQRAHALFAVDDVVVEKVDALKKRGFTSSYLKTFVVARVNPLRGAKGQADFDETMAKMIEKAQAFDPDSVDAGQISG